MLSAIIDPCASDGTTKVVQVEGSWHEPGDAIADYCRDILTFFIMLSKQLVKVHACKAAGFPKVSLYVVSSCRFVRQLTQREVRAYMAIQ